jgi:putative glutamine amidotransferase
MAAMTATVLVSAASAGRAVPYVEALKAGGVLPEAIRVVCAETAPGAARDIAAAVKEWIGGAGGLVLCGGADIEPRRYGEEPLAGAGLELAPARDALEWELLAAARERRLPVWGVCRGFQMLNVFLGGSLWQDLPTQRPGTVPHDLGSPPDLLAHEVCILEPQTPLGKRLAKAGTRPLVNSRHHQGVKRLAPGLLAVAAAPDGLVEAFTLTGAPGVTAGGAGTAGTAGTAEITATTTRDAAAPDDDSWWLRGVEWHPENLLELAEQAALWRDFAAAVAGFAGRGAGSGPAAAAPLS